MATRVNLKKGEDWTTAFIPWLEEQERNGVGAEDGAFIASVEEWKLPEGNDLKILVQTCVQHLTSVRLQKPKKFPSDGIFHLGSEAATMKRKKEYKMNSKVCQLYSSPTCCSHMQSHDELFMHFESLLFKSSRKVQSPNNLVVVEESALKLKHQYNTFSKNISEFRWNTQKKYPPEYCPNVTCVLNSDSSESEDEDEDKTVHADEHEKPISFGSEIFYGFGNAAANLSITSFLNLNRIFNILWMLPFVYPGFHTSYLYFGMTHSPFPIHVEDGLTWSLNFLHIGHPKVWVVVPPYATYTLDFFLHKAGMYHAHTSCRNLLGHKVLWPTLSWLKKRGIPFKIIIQRPGDLVIVYPNCAHYGFNMGLNIAQSINVGTVSWIPAGLNAPSCHCLPNSIHLDLTPLVASFRPDLLHQALQHSLVMTPDLRKGITFFSNETSKLHVDVHQQTFDQSCTYTHNKRMKHCVAPSKGSTEMVKCPVKLCPTAFPRDPESRCKQLLKQHVRRAHAPILATCNIVKDIDLIFLNPHAESL